MAKRESVEGNSVRKARLSKAGIWPDFVNYRKALYENDWHQKDVNAEVRVRFAPGKEQAIKDELVEHKLLKMPWEIGQAGNGGSGGASSQRVELTADQLRNLESKTPSKMECDDWVYRHLKRAEEDLTSINLDDCPGTLAVSKLEWVLMSTTNKDKFLGAMSGKAESERDGVLRDSGRPTEIIIHEFVEAMKEDGNHFGLDLVNGTIGGQDTAKARAHKELAHQNN